jgi:hypothetical protein
VRCDVAAVRWLLICLSAASGFASAQESVSGAKAPGAFNALIDGMSCRQQSGGRMDCDFRVGSTLRFVVAGVGQEDVVISFMQADSVAEYVASIAPLHGCVVVKPVRAADAARASGLQASDSAATYAFVSPRTGKVYRNWQGCLGATRRDGTRGDALSDSAMQAKLDSMARRALARIDSMNRAKAATKEPAKKPN